MMGRRESEQAGDLYRGICRKRDITKEENVKENNWKTFFLQSGKQDFACQMNQMSETSPAQMCDFVKKKF